MVENKERELEEMYMQFQMLTQEIKEIQTQMEAMQNQAADLMALKVDINEMKKVKSGTGSYTRIGPGIFVESEIKNTNEVLVTVGANIVVKKSVEDAHKLIDRQVNSIQEQNMQLMKMLQMQSMRAQQLEVEMEELIEHQKYLNNLRFTNNHGNR